MTIKETIDKAIKGGYTHTGWSLGVSYLMDVSHLKEAVLDPLFWICLGNSLKWKEKKYYQYTMTHVHLGEEMSEAQWYSRCFMNHIWEGKTIEEFFKQF